LLFDCRPVSATVMEELTKMISLDVAICVAPVTRTKAACIFTPRAACRVKLSLACHAGGKPPSKDQGSAAGRQLAATGN